MNILYFEEDNQEVIRFKSLGEYSYLDLLECPNPYCSCGEAQLVLLSKEGYKNRAADGFPVGINVFTKEIYPVEYVLSTDQKNKSLAFQNLLGERLTTEDWLLLTNKYTIQKENYIEEVNLNETLYQYEFSDEHLSDNSLMISYHSIFPMAEVFKVKNEDNEYIIIELFCKNSDCDCTEVIFEVFEEEDYLYSFTYDYKKGKLEAKKHEWIIHELKKNYINFKERINIRDLKIKNLFIENCLRIKTAYVDNLSERKKDENVGRNEKCPCGSGKKYKKCCLRNGEKE